MGKYNFTLNASAAPFEIKIDEGALYGYFEHDELGEDCGGGLWFERLAGGVMALSDFDGVFELPAKVKAALIAKGIIVSEDF